MFGFSKRLDGGPLIEGRTVFLRQPLISDFREWAVLREKSRSFLTPWEPSWNSDDLTRESFRRRIRAYDADREAGLAHAFFMVRKSDRKLTGGLTIGHVRRGAAQSCTLGYWMGEEFAGKGLMGDALGAVIPHVFDQMQLHRIEAACIPENERSRRLLESAGFRNEGYLNGYLKINGAWRDHLLYALVAEDHADRRRKGGFVR